MADKRPPCRASPRPLAVVLGCVTAACAPAGVSFVSIPRELAYPPSVGPLLVVWSNERSSRYDRASTTDVGGSPDPPLLKDNHSTLPARRFRVRSALRQTTRSTRRRTHPPVSTVSGPGEESVAFHFHPGGMCPPVLLYPYTEPENPHRAYPVPPSGKKAAADPQPGRSQSPAASAPQSPPSHDAGRALRLWTPGRRSRPTQSERHRHPS